MDTQQVQKQAKSNGKWAAQEVKEYSSDIITAVQDGLTDLVKSGTKSAQSFARKYPVQAAIGGVCAGFILGAMLARSRRTV